MPDLDTFDLDAAFRGLQQDVANLTSGPGARAAVSRSRRRRVTTAGAVVTAAAVLIGGVALARGMGRGDTPAPPVTPSVVPSAAPGRLNGPHLTAATVGWTPAWTVDDQTAQLKMAATFGGRCLPALAGGGTTSTLTVLGNAHGDVAFAEFGDYSESAARERAAWRSVQHQMHTCPQADSIAGYSSDAGQGRIYRVEPTAKESAPAYVWIVDTGRQIGILKIFDQRDPLHDANEFAVTRAVLAAAASPATYADAGHHSPGPGGIDP